jgi:hypothetical protein
MVAEAEALALHEEEVSESELVSMVEDLAPCVTEAVAMDMWSECLRYRFCVLSRYIVIFIHDRLILRRLFL